jgi:hypothetical protein
MTIGQLPAEEQEVGWSISLNLNSLSKESKNIAAAVALFLMCRERGADDLFGDWMQIAARDCALSIHNFGTALAKVRSLIGKAKSWHPLINTEALKSAEMAFNEKFPFAHKMRHSVAHPEMYNDPTKKLGLNGDLDDLGIKAEGGENLVIKSLISNSTFAATIDGILVRFDLTSETLDVVISIVNKTFDAFSQPNSKGVRIFPPFQFR